MPESIQLSIILTTHGDREHFHSLLTNILDFSFDKFELIVINDASDSVDARFIQQGIEKSSHDRVFLFEHEQKMGRGASLNEALLQASGDFLWCPLRADRLNEQLLKETLRKFKTDPMAFWTLDYNLPSEWSEWAAFAEEGDLPADGCIVWNRNIIHHSSLFFNPFQEQLHGAELALRLHAGNTWQKTDPFFVVADNQSPCADILDLREILFMVYRTATEEAQRSEIISQLSELSSKDQKSVQKDEYLAQARQLLDQGEGDAKRSLELINRFLKRNPDHYEANRIKIASLEKLRRHVEAAELKHSLNRDKRASAAEKEQTKTEEKIEPKTTPKEPAKSEKQSIETSIVIPTTAIGKPFLESSLTRLDEVADPVNTELIIIDNASIDDTFDYLLQLKSEKFLNIKVVTNKTNCGFAASVNQGLDTARGKYVLVMHNDVLLSDNTISELTSAIEETGAWLAAPLVTSSRVALQKKNTGSDEPYAEADMADSCCFMVPKELPVRFDEEFGLCFYEMRDFCRQIREDGENVVIARNTEAEHYANKTSKLMGLMLVPELNWQNKARFRNKWGGHRNYKMPESGTHPERFQKLGAPDNPMQPEPEWVNTIQDYLSKEVKAEILNTDWKEEELLTIILTLLIADERELLRTLEDRLEKVDPDPSLVSMFIQYYFGKNIYSRCRHYLEMADGKHPMFDLYRLKIMVAEKEFEDAIPLLNDLLDNYPASPDLFYLAGDMYQKSGDKSEAESFFALANQLDPFRFKPEGSTFEINH